MKQLLVHRVTRIVLVFASLALAGAGAYFGMQALSSHVPPPPLGKCHLLTTKGRPTPFMQRCLIERSDDLVQRDGLGAIATVQREADRHPVLLTMCHTAMHHVGRKEGVKLDDPEDVRAAMRAIPPQAASCGAGLMHGVLEGYVERHGLDHETAQVFYEASCRTATVPLDTMNCAHGLGHAIARKFSLDLPRILDVCEGMQGAAAMNCVSATYMSLAEGVDLTGGPMSSVRTTAQLTAFCDAHQPRYELLCIRWYPVAPDWTDVTLRQRMEVCSGLAGDLRTECFMGIGRAGEDFDKVDHCVSIDSRELQAACAYGETVAAFLHSRGAVLDRAARCDDAYGDGGLACALGVGRGAVLLGSVEDAAAYCRRFTDARTTWCRRGLDLAGEPLDGARAELVAVQALGAAVRSRTA